MATYKERYDRIEKNGVYNWTGTWAFAGCPGIPRIDGPCFIRIDGEESYSARQEFQKFPKFLADTRLIQYEHPVINITSDGVVFIKRQHEWEPI